MGIDKGRIDVVVANSQLPDGGFYLVTIWIGTDNTLIVIQTLVDDIPLCHFTLEVLHNVSNVVLHDVECLLARPMLIILLAFIATQPFGLLLIPNQTVATDSHFIILGKTNKSIGTAITELSLRRLQDIHLHLILGHQHIILLGSLSTLVVITFIGTESATDKLFVLLRVVA